MFLINRFLSGNLFSQFQDKAATGGHLQCQLLAGVVGLAPQLVVLGVVVGVDAIGEQGDVDTAIITMKMANGALAVIDNSRRAAYGYDQRAELFGSKGMVATSNDTLSSAVLSNADGVTGEKPLFFFLERYMESFSEEMRQFVAAVENDTEVPVGIHAGMQSVKIGLAAKKSVAEHRPVALSEIE